MFQNSGNTSNCIISIHILKMEKRVVPESEKNLWRKIKRNGYFSKRKKEMIKHLSTKCVPNEGCSSALKIRGCDEEYLVSRPVIESIGNPDFSIKEQLPLNDPSDEIGVNDSDDEFEDSSNSQDPQEFCDQIKKWAVDFQIKHTAVNALLMILKSHIPENVLPKCARTLVQTPRSTVISMDDRLGGQYWHYGLRKVIVETLSRFEKVPNKVSLNINIDGLPAFKSSSKSFWPILVNIHEIRDTQSPLIVGVFCGGSKSFFLFLLLANLSFSFVVDKPKDVNAFLEPFVCELNEILQHGIMVAGENVHISLRCFICDTPARSMLRGMNYYICNK